MISWQEVLLRLSLASFFGAVIGLERERKNWTAGLRTHMMVCLGSSLAIIVSAYGFADVLSNKNVVLDPSRVAAQVISGIGFIGAGTILFLRQGIIRGLTTASGLWTVAAIGLAAGAGLYLAALIATIWALAILWMLQPFEKRIAERFRSRKIMVITGNNANSLDILNRVFKGDNTDIASCSVEKGDDETTISFSFNNFDNTKIAGILKELHSDVNVKQVLWNGERNAAN